MENSLYKITQKQQELFDFILEAEGEITPDVEESLKINAENFESKARSYIWMIKKLESENVTISNELERLKHIEKRNDKLIDRLKESMKMALEIFGESKKIDTFTLSIKETKSTDIFDAELVPEKFKVTETVITTKIPKDEIKKAIDSGEEVPGAKIVTNKTLQIK